MIEVCQSLILLSMTPEEPRNEATPADLKALAHPLRMRILRLCLHESITNKQIAERLDLDPATSLYHVRQLAQNGFLDVEPVRTGKRGALEKPYRATGKSWSLSFPRADDHLSTLLAGLDAARTEVVTAGPDSVIFNTRAGLRLDDAGALGSNRGCGSGGMRPEKRLVTPARICSLTPRRPRDRCGSGCG